MLGYQHLYGLSVPKSCLTSAMYYLPVAEQVRLTHSCNKHVLAHTYSWHTGSITSGSLTLRLMHL